MPSLRLRVSDRQVQSPFEMPELQRYLDRRTALFLNHESESRQRGVIGNAPYSRSFHLRIRNRTKPTAAISSLFRRSVLCSGVTHFRIWRVRKFALRLEPPFCILVQSDCRQRKSVIWLRIRSFTRVWACFSEYAARLELSFESMR